MSHDWLRAEPLWFGVHLIPEDGIQKEPKRRVRQRRQAEEDQGTEDGKPRRRSLTAERRRKALERKERIKAGADDEVDGADDDGATDDDGRDDTET